MMHQLFRCFSISAVILCLSAGSALAVTINSTDEGWYRNDGVHFPTNTNIIDGFIGNFQQHHNFFTFNLASLAGQSVTAVSLTIFADNGFYVSADPQETFQTFDYTGSIAFISRHWRGCSIHRSSIGQYLWTNNS